jgi:hypothetical protein
VSSSSSSSSSRPVFSAVNSFVHSLIVNASKHFLRKKNINNNK